MKICITSQGDSLESQVDPRFGRCRFFVFTDVVIDVSKFTDNPNIDTTGGAGINAAQFVAAEQAKVVLTGNVGPNAFKTLSAAGISVVTGVTGTVAEVIENYKKGEYKPVDSPSVNSHFGMP